MRTLALLVGLLLLVLGALGLLVPDTLRLLARYVGTPVGLYVVAILRVTFGVILIRAAPITRSPLALRILGVIVFVSGLLTPIFGIDRARAYVDWWTAQPPGMVRVWALLLLALGMFVAWAATGTPELRGRRARRRRAPAT